MKLRSCGRNRVMTIVVVAASLLYANRPRGRRRWRWSSAIPAYRNVPSLANPGNDASEMDNALGRLGFSVTRLNDASYDRMRRAFLEFGRQVRGAEMAVVFFAGHGIEVGGEIWLIPIDAELEERHRCRP